MLLSPLHRRFVGFACATLLGLLACAGSPAWARLRARRQSLETQTAPSVSATETVPAAVAPVALNQPSSIEAAVAAADQKSASVTAAVPAAVDSRQALAEIAEIRRAVGDRAADDGFAAALEHVANVGGQDFAVPGAGTTPARSLSALDLPERIWGKATVEQGGLTAAGCGELPTELRGLARKLDVRAAALEDARNFAEADHLRGLAQTLREEARQMDVK